MINNKLMVFKMSTNKKNCNYFEWIFFLSILLVTLSDFNYAQIDTKQLENQVEKTIGTYYTEIFKISADQKGIVTLEGDVTTLFDKLRIQELASQVEGVAGINNKIEVNVEPTADAIIKANIEDDLKSNNVILEPEKITVDVKDGVVNLAGTVSYFREKLMAQSVASWQDGVVDMTSSIKVLSPAAAKSDSNLKDIIRDILNEHFPLENNMTFTVTNGIVTLNGKVKSLYAKDHIQEDIQHILAITSVVNNLSLENNY